MKNPAYNASTSIYLVRYQKRVHVIPIAYTRTGGVVAFKGMTDDVLARATGYGYCKQSTALAHAVAAVIRSHYVGDISPNAEFTALAIERTAGTGVANTIEVARANGVTVADSYQYALKAFSKEAIA